MTIKNDLDFLTRFATRYAEGVTVSIPELCRTMSIEEDRNVAWSTIYMWLRDPTIILPEFMGEQSVSFKKAMNMARKCASMAVISRSLEDRVLNGTEVEVWHHGVPAYVEDEQLVSLGEKFVLEVLGLPDMLKRDADGNRIIRKRREAAPAQLVETYARAHAPNIYGLKSEVTMKGQMSLGVQVLGRRDSALIPGRIIEPVITETVRELLPAPDDELLGPEPAVESYVVDELPPVSEPLPPEPRHVDLTQRTIRSAPTEREQSSPQPVDSILGPGPRNGVPAHFRQQWADLQARAALPDKLNRRGG